MTQFQILNPQDGADLILVNKPHGFSTHAVDEKTPGIAEILQNELHSSKLLALEKKVHVIHRLDKTTTGCLLFALNETRAKEYFEYFKNHDVKKRYLFLTAARPEQTEYLIQSKIEMKSKKIENDLVSKSNAETLFKKVKLNAFFQLWEAFPKTGKPHQVRIHATQAGIPILGDALYGGAEFPHLCLHASDIEIPKYGKFSSPMPIFFERMGLIRDKELCGILSSFERRQRIFNFLQRPDECLRLSHLDNPKFRIDLFGNILWVYWYHATAPIEADLERFEFLEGLLKRKILIRKMQNRGADPNEQTTWTFGTDSLPEIWTATESLKKYYAQYEFRTQQGLSPGLFMDQRKNRHWVFENAKDRRALNLFAYTCGFSLSAALGKAKEVVTVDLSKNFLEWGKKNFELNDLSPKAPNYLFFAQNTLKFLEITIKKQKTFDLIVCDPPSFSRDGKTIWKIEKDFPELLKLCTNVLAPGGKLLFSTNFEGWTENQLLEIAKKVLSQIKNENFQVLIPDFAVWDYELPKEEKLMKCILITRTKGLSK